MLGPHVVLKCHCVDKSFFTTDLTLVYHISAGASPLVELMVVPLFKRLITGGTINFLVGVFLSVFPLDPVMSLHDVGVQGLLVLGAVVAALPIARKSDVLAITVLLPCVLI